MGNKVFSRYVQTCALSSEFYRGFEKLIFCRRIMGDLDLLRCYNIVKDVHNCRNNDPYYKAKLETAVREFYVSKKENLVYFLELWEAEIIAKMNCSFEGMEFFKKP